MRDELKRDLVTTLPREFLLDLDDMAAARALAAHEMVRDHAGLDDKRARELVGQARFRMLEKGFQEVCELHGGIALTGGLIPETNLRVFQPFMRFKSATKGVILGLASMRARRELPYKNQSRAAGVTLNYYLTPRFDFDGRGPKAGDIFVLFLVARDPARVGTIDEVAIGIVDAEYNSYLFYEPLEEFMADYADTPHSNADVDPLQSPSNDPDVPNKPLVALKSVPKVYKPPEESDNDNETNNSPA